MEEYEELKIEIIPFEEGDIIIASTGDPNDDNNGQLI